MPLTEKGSKILSSMQQQYGDKKGKSVFYASINAGKIKGVEGRQQGGTVAGLVPKPEDAAHLIDIMPRGEPSVLGTVERLTRSRHEAQGIPRRQTGGLFAPPP